MRHHPSVLLLFALLAVRVSAAQQPNVGSGVSGEIVTSISIAGQPIPADVELYLPPGVSAVGSVLVFVNRGLDEFAFDNRWWRAMCVRARCAMLRLSLPDQDEATLPPGSQLIRNAAVGGGQVVLTALEALARRTGHLELSDAGVIVYGFSAAGNFGPTFAQWRPDRTLGFIRYHSNLRGIPIDVSRIAHIPALIIAGGADSVAGIEDSERSWRAARAVNAPWAFIVHPGQPHGSVDGLIFASPLMRSWVEGVLAMRHNFQASDSMRSGNRRLTSDSAWLANNVTAEIERVAGDGRPWRAFAQTSWFPDEKSANAWFALRGACASLTETQAEEILGPGVRRLNGPTNVCEYASTPGEGTLSSTLRLTITRRALVGGGQQAWSDSLRRAGGVLQPGLKNTAFVMVDAQRRCRTFIARRATDVVEVSRCGRAYDSVETIRAMDALANGLLDRP